MSEKSWGRGGAQVRPVTLRAPETTEDVNPPISQYAKIERLPKKVLTHTHTIKLIEDACDFILSSSQLQASQFSIKRTIYILSFLRDKSLC